MAGWQTVGELSKSALLTLCNLESTLCVQISRPREYEILLESVLPSVLMFEDAVR